MCCVVGSSYIKVNIWVMDHKMQQLPYSLRDSDAPHFADLDAFSHHRNLDYSSGLMSCTGIYSMVPTSSPKPTIHSIITKK